MSKSQDFAKRMAARAGADFVRTGMTIGLGSGSTAEMLVEELGEKVQREGLDISAVATSERTSELARAHGIRIIGPDQVDGLDLIIDGADEVDPHFRMIKGRGGALLREKIVATSAKRRIILVDRTKPVSKLGEKHALPVEISDFGKRWIINSLDQLAQEVTLRTLTDGRPFLTDGGNRIADLRTGPIDDPELLQSRILAIPGVYETGLFIGLCNVLIIGDEHTVEIRHHVTE